MQLPAYRRTARQRLALEGEVCPQCGAKLYPPRDVCPRCAGPARTAFVFGGRGTVYSYTHMYAAPERFAHLTPYTVAIVKLDEGPLVTAQITDADAEDIYVGMPVEMVTRRMYEEGEDGVVVYNAKFRPLLQQVPASV